MAVEFTSSSGGINYGDVSWVDNNANLLIVGTVERRVRNGGNIITKWDGAGGSSFYCTLNNSGGIQLIIEDSPNKNGKIATSNYIPLKKKTSFAARYRGANGASTEISLWVDGRVCPTTSVWLEQVNTTDMGANAYDMVVGNLHAAGGGNQNTTFHELGVWDINGTDERMRLASKMGPIYFSQNSAFGRDHANTRILVDYNNSPDFQDMSSGITATVTDAVHVGEVYDPFGPKLLPGDANQPIESGAAIRNRWAEGRRY